MRKPAPASFEVMEDAELFTFLLSHFPNKNRDNIKTLLRDKQILVDGAVVTQYNHPLHAGQQVEVSPHKISGERDFHGISIIYEDRDIIVIDKHAGMLSMSDGKERHQTAYGMLSRHVKTEDAGNKIFIVHRLDRETSGVMMFAKSEKVQRLLQESWRDTVTERTYLAITEGIVEKDEGVIRSYLKESKALIVYSSQDPLHGELAVTRYQVLKRKGDFTMLKINLETGQKNQIRVHMKDIGHPILGDKKYGSTIDPIGRVALHAWVLAFIHPVTGEKLRFETPMPRKFMRLF